MDFGIGEFPRGEVECGDGERATTYTHLLGI